MSKRRQRRERGHTDEDFAFDTVYDADQARYGGEMQEELIAAARKRPKTRPVPLSDIVVDREIQVRVGGEDGLDPKHIDSLVQILINGGTFKDDIVLFYENEDMVNGSPEPAPPFILADGFHRRVAYIEALVLARQMLDAGDALPEGVNLSAFEAPRCSLHYGTWQDAFEYAEEANLKHGQMLSNKDKKNILYRRLERDHPWRNLSSNAIAAELGVTDKTVTRWRDEILDALGATSENSEVVGADGKIRDVSKIGPQATLTPEQKLAKKAVRSLTVAAGIMGRLGYDEKDLALLAQWSAALAADFGLDQPSE